VFKAYLLTGQPGVGKTSIIKEAVQSFKDRAGGFYTQEVRDKGKRTGFELVTLTGDRAMLAHVMEKSPYKVSKYGVDTDNLDRVGVAAVKEAIMKYEIVVIDEIGKMELFSDAFKEAVLKALDSGKKTLGTIMLSSHSWADNIKKRYDVNVVTVTRTNQAEVLGEVLHWLENK
jgi:nucleoside-triphosphatase